MRAARVLLRWTAERLSQTSGVGLATIKRAEATDEQVRMIPANAGAVQTALEAGGIEFIPANGGGVGVRLRRLYVRFWMTPSDPKAALRSLDVIHDGPVAFAKLVGEATMQDRIHPTAIYFTIHDHQTDQELYRSNEKKQSS